MNDLLLFLTSKEIMIVYILILAILFLSIVVWLIERSYYKRKLRHNTKELNRLVDEVGERLVEEEKTKPVPATTIEATIPTKVEEKIEVIEPTPQVELKPVVEPPKEEIVYETIEDEQLQAQEEIRKITESLIDVKEEEPIENIALTKFEEEQEKNSIISIDELMATKEMYKVEEINDYEDESNVILSINELENLKNNTQPVVKNEVEPVKLTVVDPKDIKPNVKVVDEKKPATTFKSSPVISPIFGLENKEKVEKNNVMNLENSATYDKFDEEIRKTNEFLNTLKELQKKLD